MDSVEQIKNDTRAAALELLNTVVRWPPGPWRTAAVDLAKDILSWNRRAGERPLQPVLSALESVPSSYARDLESLYHLHVRMILEHGVEAGLFKRGADPDLYTSASAG